MKKRNYALLAGWSLLLMALIAGFSFGYVHSTLVLIDNPTLTLTKVQNAIWLFGSEVIGWLIILITDILVAWSLYRFFEPVDQRISLITGAIRVVYSIVLAFSVYQLIMAWRMASTVNSDAYALLEHIANFEKYWSWGLIIFGPHLVGIGYLSHQSKKVPQWIGLLLYVAGVSYTLINLGKMILPEAIELILGAENIMSLPMAIAELGFAFWLLLKGGRPSKVINSEPFAS